MLDQNFTHCPAVRQTCVVACSVTAGRIAYSFGLKGPAMAVDTACSSSLVTLHVALNSLHAQQCTMATSSGVNLILMPQTHAMFQLAGMLSAVGR